MEKKIEDFAEERFSFELPEILVLPSSLDISVRTDTDAVGSFKVRFEDEVKYNNRKIRGYITCNDYRFKFNEPTFSNYEVEVDYGFDGTGLKPGLEYSGNIHLITDCGEINLPYFICVKEAELMADSDEIKNIYQFAAFAKNNPERAVELFYENEFEKVILNDLEEESLVRKGLLANRDKRRALEEFLCYTKSKQPVKIIVDKKIYNYHISGVEIKDRIIIRKSGWGYVKAEIITEGNFIKVYKNEITDDLFENGICEFDVYINPEYIRSEKAYGKVVIKTLDEEIPIEFNLVNTAVSSEKFAGKRRRFEYINKLITEYFSYRMGVGTVKNVTTAMRTALYGVGLSGKDEDLVNYVNIYLYFINRNEKKAKEELIKLNGSTTEPLFRLIHLYFMYQLAEEDEKEDYRREVEKLTNIKGYKIGLYFLIHMDGRYKLNLERRLEFIAELYKGGFHSSFLLMEAWSIYKSQPDYFSKLDEFSIQVVNWAIKHGFFAGRIITEKFVLLANGLRDHNVLVLRLLKEVYKNWGVEEVAQAICAQLIRKNNTDADDHEWFRIGVKRGIKLTGIYERYMRTMKNDTTEKIELSVFSYFLYDNTLSTEKKALLYSYLINQRNELDFQDIYKKYKEQIKEFAGEQIRKGEMNDALAAIYKAVFKDGTFLSEHYSYLSSVIFKKKFVCMNKNIQSLIICTRGLIECKSFKFNDGIAFADVPGEYSVALVADKGGNLYPADEFCSSERMINYYDYLDGCYEAGDRSLNELLTVVAENDRYHKESRYLLEICEELTKMREITCEYKCFLRGKLINSYFEANEGEKLELVLKRYDFAKAKLGQAEHAAEMAVIRNTYPLSLYSLRRLSYNKINLGKLTRVISTYLCDEDEKRKAENHNLIISASYRLMLDKKADDGIMIFLRDNYEGGVTELNFIYDELKERKLLTKDFASRLIRQMLFSEEMAVEYDRIFEYYEEFEEGILSKAFLSYVSYKWLVKNMRVGKYLEKRIRDEAYKTKNTLFIISYLKILGEKKYLTDEEKDYVSVWVERLVEDGITLPFFKDFKNKCRLPAEIENLNFVVCYADNEDEAAINYRIFSTTDTGNRAYKVEWMKNVYQGIFVKEFLVFADETIQYYISLKEKGNNEAVIISSDELVIKQDVLFEEELGLSLFSQINMMYICKDLSDEKTLKEYMKNYVIQSEIIDNIFSLEAKDEELEQ